MKTEWDYTDLAEAYVKRPDYSPEGLGWMLESCAAEIGAKVADIGAGVGHLAIKLAESGFDVSAVEPNDRMREIGAARTRDLSGLQWREATGENTGLPDNHFHLVTFGSSFNVVDRGTALAEARRIAAPQGWFACMWNHRDLEDPLQSAIENIISRAIPDYNYGARRADQTEFLRASNLFQHLMQRDASVVHTQSIEDVLEAWRSHGTLHRQAGEKFPNIIQRISELLSSTGGGSVDIPYTTRIWLGEFA